MWKASIEARGRLGIEAGVANGHRGLGHEAFQQLLLVIAEGERRSTAQREHTQQLILELNRHPEKASETVLHPPRLREYSRIAEHVGHGERLACARDPAHDALPEVDGPERIRRSYGLVRVRPDPKRLGIGIGDPRSEERRVGK